MRNDQQSPYAPPKSRASAARGGTTGFESYDDVPLYRRQWFFWLFFFIFSPIAIGILITGEVYYVKQGEVHAFGMANRIVAGVIGTPWVLRIFASVGGATL